MFGAPPDDRSPAQPGQTVTVLIADDEASIRAGLEKIISLDEAMVLVAVATDAEEAIDLARQHQPAVALLDINMPGGGGPRATAGIRGASPRTKVIAHSFHDDRAAVMEMVRAGAVGYVVKGATADDILTTLRRAGAGQSTLSAEVVSTVVFELASILQMQEQQAEARRAQVSRARRLIAGGGVAILTEPVVDLHTGVQAGRVARSVMPGDAAFSLDAELASADAVGYRVEVELALCGRALREAAPPPAGAYLGIPASAATVTSPGFTEMLSSARAFQVMVELSGATTTPDYEVLQAVLAGLRASGVLLAVAGVGTSEHGMYHALRLRPNVVKVAAPSVAAPGADPAEGSFLAGMQVFAQALGAHLLVEGIGSTRDAEIARSAGARLGQGQHFAAAVAPAGDGTATEAQGSVPTAP